MLPKDSIKKYLSASGEKQQELFDLARQTKERVFGKRIHFRGIIEFSNMCQNDCNYCGIRKSNSKVDRFKMGLLEIEKCLDFINSIQYGSVVFQSGELHSKQWQGYLLDIISLTRTKYPKMGITVSCGEQSFDFYKKMRQAGAERYLLRIETANPALYRKLHPKSMSWQNRYQCLKWLKELDYQVGTGIMVGLPEQTTDDLINDLAFFEENEFDMFGLGPYVIHENTPLSTKKVQQEWRKNKDQIFNLTLNFLAVLRLTLPSVNIAAATALDVFDPLGRIKALQIAANIIMPTVTPTVYRQKYLLYENKPCIDEDALMCSMCLTSKIKVAGLEPVFNQLGTSPHFIKRNNV